jgi:hypothetical protein
MTEPTPPPDQRLPEHARARIRAELLGAIDASPAGAHRWAVLAAAAVSVVLVAGLAAWAVGVGDGTNRPDRDSPATSTSGTPSSTTDATPTADATSPPTTAETSVPVPTDPSTMIELPSADCAPELKRVLRAAEPALAFPGEDGNTSIWVRDQQFTLCVVGAGTVTVHKPLPLEPDLDDVATFRVSSVYAPTEQGYRILRAAGGVVPEGAIAFDVAYTFPDGHTEKATTATDEQGRTWWRMVYAYDDDGGNEMEKPPIEVSVTLSGSGFGFTLDWGRDTCAQANHGC